MSQGPLPNALDAEAAIISSMILSAAEIDRVVLHGFKPEHCYADANRIIVTALIEMHATGSVVDVVTLSNRLRDKGTLASVGGNVYLMQIADATPAIANVLDHATIVMEKARLRSAIKLWQVAVAEGYGPIEDTQAFLEKNELAIAEIAHVDKRVKLESVGDIATREIDRITEARRTGNLDALAIRTGIRKLDDMIGGLMGGNVYIVGARPGMGKTAFANSIAVHIARPSPIPNTRELAPGFAALFFSMEMPKQQMMARLWAHETGVEIGKVLTGDIGHKFGKLLEVSVAMQQWPLYIDDTPSLTLMEVRATIRMFKRRLASGAITQPNRGLGLVAIDYLQLMRGIVRKGGSREEEVSSISRGLKEIAKEENVAMMVLSQLNRNVEKNTKDKRPVLADLRESGSIEQDADVVAFLYRDGYYNREANKRDAEIILAKQRNGPTGIVEATFNEDELRWYNRHIDNPYDEEFQDDKFFEDR